MVERFNRTILNNLSLMVSKNQQDWDQKVPLFLLAYRSAVHETTGYSPSQMLFGRDLRLPCDLLFGRPPDTPSSPEEYVQNLQARFEDVHNLARERINLRTEKMKTRYDTKATGHQFKEGDKVWFYNPTRRKGLSPKLQSHWDGPYTILKIINDVVIRILFSLIVRDFLELFYNLWRTVLAKNKIVLDPALRLQTFRTPENATIGVRSGILNLLWTPPRVVLQTVTGEKIDIHGKLKVKIKFGDTTYQHAVYVADIADPFILGLDFLKEHGFTLDFNKNELRSIHEEVTIFKIEHRSESIRQVTANENITIPPRTEIIVPGYIGNDVSFNSGLIGSAENKANGLLIASTLVDLSRKTIPVRICNVTEKSRVFQKGEVLATCSPVTCVCKSSSLLLSNSPQQLTPDLLENAELSPEQKSSAERLFQEFEDVFSRNSSDIGHTTVTQHRIDTADHPPIKQHPRRLPFVKQEEVGTLLREMQENDIIEPSSSPWASPIVLVRKKDGSTRFCVDYRKLNDVTKKDSYPLPRIDDTLDTLSGHKWFSTLDLKSGYWQVEIHPEDREKQHSLPAKDYGSSKSCRGRTFEEHLQNIRKVLSKLSDANLKLNPSKCKFFQKEVNYLGHIISAEGVRTDPEKVSAVKNWKRPENLQALTSSPILIYPQPDKPFILDTDASNESVGAVLSQEIDGQERVVAYWSKCLSKPERNYCVTRKELLAIVKAIEHFHHYLYGQKFLLRTDHASLTWLMNFRNTQGQVARWIQRLNEYYFDIRHRKGSSHGNADALSRRPCPENCRHCSRVETKYDYAIRQITTSTATPPDPWSDEKVREDQMADPDIKPLIEFMESSSNKPSWQDISAYSPTTKQYWALWNSLHLRNGVLYRKFESEDGKTFRWQLVLPRSRIPEVLKELHGSPTGGHFGVMKTLHRVRERFCWGKVRADVEQWCKSCDACSARKGPKIRSRGKLHRYNVGAPFERIAFDILGPLPRTASGNKYLLVVIDYFTKWPEVYPIPDQEAPTVAEAVVQHWISRYGVPLQLHSDQGRNFVSAVLK
ncbi:retrovirus-related Pol polyprotein from transposon 412 [Trichonephila clavipes]|nr:retrovirus-related Pol polyprotein from transposon 412 [Trichonephila clavipes]